VRVGSSLLAHARTFEQVPVGQAFWYENSNGLVELAVNQGRADQRLPVSIGDQIDLE
jgi:S-adenosylmethionine hydrolase